VANRCHASRCSPVSSLFFNLCHRRAAVRAVSVAATSRPCVSA
jgi:hypothetical protein